MSPFHLCEAILPHGVGSMLQQTCPSFEVTTFVTLSERLHSHHQERFRPRWMSGLVSHSHRHPILRFTSTGYRDKASATRFKVRLQYFILKLFYDRAKHPLTQWGKTPNEVVVPERQPQEVTQLLHSCCGWKILNQLNLLKNRYCGYSSSYSSFPVAPANIHSWGSMCWCTLPVRVSPI